MTGLCHRCGYLHTGPAKDQGPRDAWAKLWKRLAWSLFWRLDCEQVGHRNAVKACNELQAQLAAKDKRFNDLEAKIDIMLDILMSTSDAARANIISKIKKKKKTGDLLASIRKANNDTGS